MVAILGVRIPRGYAPDIRMCSSVNAPLSSRKGFQSMDAYSCTQSFTCLVSDTVEQWQAGRHFKHQTTETPHVSPRLNVTFKHLPHTHHKLISTGILLSLFTL